ncbi:MAG: putative hemolysin [Solidesulfovibrio sp. DCME]|uniref:putative hemolysin n=1 Tax=Solidesulfovibrio sp. DCME TaxID=3447380 RepID=UPI003D1374E2
MRRLLILAAILSVLAATATSAPAQMVGLPNPASTFCVDTGGTLVITNTGTGEVGNCVYGSGLAVDEWALYRFFSGFSDPLTW